MRSQQFSGFLVLTLFAWSWLDAAAAITYPNQLYILSGQTFLPVPGAFNVKAIAVEHGKALAVTQDGRVVAHGFPEGWLAGVLDQVTNAVSVGLNHTMGAVLTADGRVIEFGNSGIEPSPGLTNVLGLDVAGQSDDDDLDYKVAVTSDRQVITWGNGYQPPSKEVPGVVTASGGWSHIVALRDDGTVVEWESGSEPAAVAGLSNVVAVAAGGTHSVALKADGTVVAWGQNFDGQANVPPGVSNVVAIAASDYRTVALKSDGTLLEWGPGGQTVLPPNLPKVMAIASGAARVAVISALPAPPPVPYPNQAFIFDSQSFSPVPGFTNIKAFAVESGMALAVTRDGRLIGSGSWVPEENLARVTNAVAVGLSAVQAAALTADGGVIDLEYEPRWPQPPGLTNVIALDVFGQAGDDDLDHKLAVTSDGRVIVWGSYEDLPPPPDLDLTGVIAAAGGWSHVAALKSDGTVVAWGSNGGGQLDVPEGLDTVTAIAAGGMHTVALKTDETVVAWGWNAYGQLNVPPGLSNVVAIAAAEYHSLALKRDGTMVAWGQAPFSGGSVTPPAGLSNVVAIAVSGLKNLALVSPPPVPPTLGIASVAPLMVRLSGQTNTVYTIETSEDLLNWHFGQYVTNETDSTSFEPRTINTNRLFFRAK